jgi:hypothetical protein
MRLRISAEVEAMSMDASDHGLPPKVFVEAAGRCSTGSVHWASNVGRSFEWLYLLNEKGQCFFVSSENSNSN